MKFDMKVLVRCRIRFESAWIHYATVLTGLSFFLLVVNFFGLRNLMDCSFGEIVFSMAIPMAIWIGFMVLLRGIHFQNARLYGVLGALYCVCMIAHTFSYDNIFLTVFAVVWYVLTAVICLGTTCGFIANRAYMSLSFFLPAIYRLVFVDLGKYIFKLDVLGFVPEAAALSGLAVFGLFALALEAKAINRTPKKRVRTE